MDLSFCSHDFLDLENVRVVIKTAHGIDFADYTWLHCGIDGFGFVDNFDSDGGSIDEGAGLVDFGEAATAEEAG
jgi:hypothetical protein